MASIKLKQIHVEKEWSQETTKNFKVQWEHKKSV